eukprot:280460_1
MALFAFYITWIVSSKHPSKCCVEDHKGLIDCREIWFDSSITEFASISSPISPITFAEVRLLRLQNRPQHTTFKAQNLIESDAELQLQSHITHTHSKQIACESQASSISYEFESNDRILITQPICNSCIPKHTKCGRRHKSIDSESDTLDALHAVDSVSQDSNDLNGIASIIKLYQKQLQSTALPSSLTSVRSAQASMWSIAFVEVCQKLSNCSIRKIYFDSKRIRCERYGRIFDLETYHHTCALSILNRVKCWGCYMSHSHLYTLSCMICIILLLLLSINVASMDYGEHHLSLHMIAVQCLLLITPITALVPTLEPSAQPTVCRLAEVKQELNINSFTNWLQVSNIETPVEGETFTIATGNETWGCYVLSPCIYIKGITSATKKSNIYVERTLDVSGWLDITIQIEGCTYSFDEQTEQAFFVTTCDTDTAVWHDINKGIHSATRYSECFFIDVSFCTNLIIQFGGYLSTEADHIWLTYLAIGYTETPSPTLYPTPDPTSDPTIDPTIDPTADPTAAPSTSPSAPPTNAPTYNPTMAPSFSPTSSPSRIPTRDVDEIYDTKIEIVYEVKNLTPNNKRFIVDNTRLAVDTFEYVIERAYFDEANDFKYTDFWCDIYEINGINIESATVDSSGSATTPLSIYELDQYPDQGMVLSAKIECDGDNGEIVIKRSGTTLFTDVVQESLVIFLNNSNIEFTVVTSEHVIHEELKFPTTEPEELEDLTAMYLSMCIVSVGALQSFAALIFKKSKRSNVDSTVWIAPFLVSLAMYDFISDVNLAIQMFKNDQIEYKINNEYLWLGGLSLVFIVLPFIMNIFYAKNIRSQKVISESPSAQSWFTAYLGEFILICILCSGTYPVLILCNSEIFGLEFFDLGLLRSDMQELSKIRIRTTIFMENCPQLVIQVVYLIITKKFENATILAFIASSLSVIAAFTVYRAQREQVKGTVIVKYFVRFAKDAQMDDSQKKQIACKKGYKEKLAKEMCKAFGIDLKSIEVGFVTPNAKGCVVRVQHSIFQKHLEREDYVLKDERYILDLYTDKKEAITTVFREHFFGKSYKDQVLFTVSYDGHEKEKDDVLNPLKEGRSTDCVSA